MKSAMDAVRQWKYKPTMINGNPVNVDTTVTVIFTLGGSSASVAPFQFRIQQVSKDSRSTF